MVLIGSVSAYALADLSKTADRNGVYPKYSYAKTYDGSTREKAVRTAELTWSGPKGDIKRPTAGFKATGGGKTCSADSGQILSIGVGERVNFTDTSRVGSGSSIEYYDMQIHTNGRVIESSHGSFINSHTFDEPGSYTVYLNVYDNTADYLTRGWGNYAANGSHDPVGKYGDTYGKYHFVQLQIQVADIITGVVETHFLWDGNRGSWVELDQSTTLIDREDVPKKVRTKYMSDMDDGKDYKYLGYLLGEKVGRKYNTAKYYDATPDLGEVIFVNFYYTTVQYIEPPDVDIPSGSDDTLGDNDKAGKPKKIKIVFKHRDKADTKGTIMDDVTWTVYVPTVSVNGSNIDAAFQYQYEIPDIPGYTFKELQLQIVFRGKVKNGNILFDIWCGECMDGHTYTQGLLYTKNASSGGGESGYVPDVPDDPPEDPDVPSEVGDVEEVDTYPTVSVDVTLDSVSGTNVNYKTLSGTIKGSASAVARVTNGSISGRISDHTTSIGLNNYSDTKEYTDINNEVSTQNNSNTVSISRSVSRDDIGALLIGTPGVDTEYEFYMTAYSSAVLNRSIGTEPIRGSDYDGGTGSLTLDNVKPTAKVDKFITKIDHYIDGEGNRVDIEPREIMPGYYYKNTPIIFNSTFSDYENDLAYTVVYIGKGNTPGSGNVLYRHTIGVNPNTGVDITELQNPNEDRVYKTEVTEATNYKYKMSYTPLTEGDYWYMIECYDAKELLALTKSSGRVSGTFTVRGEPTPPVADVTEPSFAYEQEKVEFTQNSTDPNGIDDIIKYEWKFPDTVTPTYNTSTPAGKDGGSMKFPSGTAGNIYNIEIKVTDATGLSDTDTIKCKVIDQIPIARLEIIDNEANADRTQVKENRKITVSAANSLQPKAYPILWNESTWEVKAIGGGAKDEYINWDTTATNGNKQRVLQFDRPGKYRVTVNLVNQYSKDNPNSPDIAAAKAYIDITVYEDKIPQIDVRSISNKPNFVDNPVSCVTVFDSGAMSTDNDIIKEPSGYSWRVYQDKNGDKKFTEDELLPTSAYVCDSTNKTISITTNFKMGSHNHIKAVATATETFGQPYVASLLASDGSWKRQAEDYAEYVINWVPSLELGPTQGPSTTPSDVFNPNPGTPYDNVDLDGDGITDGKFIRAYTDDFFGVRTKITDELPDVATMTWTLEKKNHSGTYDKTDDAGKEWIKSRKVSHTLGHDGGTMRIDSPGIYKLTGTVTDDCGETDSAYIYIRVYTLPQAVLDSNPKYQKGGEWITKENIRFDLRSTPTIVDDEWGIAWHRMDWSKDNWDVTPKDGQNVSEIHFMDENYTARYNDAIAGDNVFSGRNSPIGFGFQTVNTIDIIAMPGAFGNYTAENEHQLNDRLRNELYTAANQLADKIRNVNPYYNVNVLRAPAYKDVWIEKPNVFGFFSASLTDGGVAENKYLVDGSIKYSFTDSTAVEGSTEVAGDLDKMIADGANFGWVDIVDAYNVSYPESAANLPLENGDIKVYMTLYKEVDGSEVYIAEDVLVATGTCEEDLQKAIEISRADGDDTWTITTQNGTRYDNVTGKMKIRVHHKNQPDDSNLSMLVKGWAGKMDRYWETREVDFIEAYNAAGARPGSYKFVIFANNNYGTSMYSGDIATNTKYQEVKAFLRANGINIANYGVDAATLQYPDGSSVSLPGQKPYFLDLQTALTYDGVNHTTYGFLNNPDVTPFVTENVYNWMLGIIPNVVNTQFRSCSFTEPGKYDFKYWGTNYGNKVTVPVVYEITVIPDLPPNIHGEVLDKFYRDPNDRNRATIALLGPYSNTIKRQALTVESPDGDYIDFTKITVTHDSNNNGLFTDAGDRKWLMVEGGTTTNGMDYTFNRLN